MTVQACTACLCLSLSKPTCLWDETWAGALCTCTNRSSDPLLYIDIFLCICGLFIFIVWQRQVCRSYETSAWHQSTTCAVRGTNSPRTKEQRFACIVNGIRDQTDRICVCVSVLVCFQTFFGTRRFILLNEYCPPSLAFQKDLACFCCLLCWHHFSEISKKQLTSYCCVLWRKRGAPHRKSNLFGAVVYESTSRTLPVDLR